MAYFLKKKWIGTNFCKVKVSSLELTTGKMISAYAITSRLQDTAALNLGPQL